MPPHRCFFLVTTLLRKYAWCILVLPFLSEQGQSSVFGGLFQVWQGLYHRPLPAHDARAGNRHVHPIVWEMGWIWWKGQGKRGKGHAIWQGSDGEPLSPNGSWPSSHACLAWAGQQEGTATYEGCADYAFLMRVWNGRDRIGWGFLNSVSGPLRGFSALQAPGSGGCHVSRSSSNMQLSSTNRVWLRCLLRNWSPICRVV